MLGVIYASMGNETTAVDYFKRMYYVKENGKNGYHIIQG